MPSPEDCGLLQGLLQAIDATREGLERSWGVGRLELLAGQTDPLLLARFRRQQASWSTVYQQAWAAEVVSAPLLAEVQAKCGSMQRGWLALDALASEVGHRPVAPWVWEVPLEDGSVAAFVQTEAEVAPVLAEAQREGRTLQVFTVADIGRLIDVLPKALLQSDPRPLGKPKLKADRQADAAAVENRLAAPPFDVEQGDPIPFGAAQEGPNALDG